jgi:CHAD domain-containing protein
MGFRLHRKKAVRREIRRMGLAQVHAIESALGLPSGPDVHVARRRVKRLRTLLRLVRAGLTDEVFELELERIGEIARAFALARDAEVRLETFEKIAPNRREFMAVRQVLKARAAESRKLTIKPRTLARARRRLNGTRAFFEALDLSSGGWKLIAPGLRRIYRDARNTGQKARELGEDDAMHEWRKCVKDLWHVVGILERLDARKLRPFAKRLDEIAEMLGEIHDLTLLRQELGAEEHRSRQKQAELATLTARIDSRRMALIQAAEQAGSDIFQDGTGKFADRVHASWRRRRT